MLDGVVTWRLDVGVLAWYAAPVLGAASSRQTSRPSSQAFKTARTWRASSLPAGVRDWMMIQRTCSWLR